MQSTLTAREADPHDMFAIEPDVVLAARADSPDTSRRAPDLRALVSEISAEVATQATAPKVDTSFRAVHVEKKRGKWASSFIAAFLFALMSAVGAAAWQRYGDTAQAYVATLTPLLGFSSSQAASPPAPASAPGVAAAATEQPPAEAAAPADAAVASAPAAPDQTQLVQSLSRDLAAMGQQVEQLKASIAELKTGQEQLARDAKAAEVKASEAKAFEQNMRAKVSALPPRPPVAPVRKPKPIMPPVQASVAPPLPPPGTPAPVQLAPVPPPPPPPVSAGPQDEPVIRPPMPVR